jgi:hypothetical protein
MNHRRSSIVLLILSILSPVTLSIRYELLSGHTKCISEEIHANAMTIGKYSIINPHEDHPLPSSHKVTVRVIIIRSDRISLQFLLPAISV